LAGVTTSRDARDALRRLAAEAALTGDVVLLPDDSVAAAPALIVTAALAPLHAAPAATAPRASEALHGERLVALERRGGWLRARAADGYHGWLHEGYAAAGPDDWADDWESRATGRALGAEVRVEDGRFRLPHGSRVVLRRGRDVELADGRVGPLASGAVRPTGELGVEARLVAAPEWALRWFGGAPYALGGRSDWGVDCSGLVQATYAARGAALPRDSDLQLGAGREVAIATGGQGYEAGDLLFFAAEGRVAHVALWAGAGRVTHAALARGGVGTDPLYDDAPAARQLLAGLVAVRRLSEHRAGRSASL
jgi:hypothetical protein